MSARSCQMQRTTLKGEFQAHGQLARHINGEASSEASVGRSDLPGRRAGGQQLAWPYRFRILIPLAVYEGVAGGLESPCRLRLIIYDAQFLGEARALLLDLFKR